MLRRGVTLSVSNRCEDAGHIDTSRLFDRFYRADPARTGGNGFGIGLSTARGIAEGHRGGISPPSAAMPSRSRQSRGDA